MLAPAKGRIMYYLLEEYLADGTVSEAYDVESGTEGLGADTVEVIVSNRSGYVAFGQLDQGRVVGVLTLFQVDDLV